MFDNHNYRGSMSKPLPFLNRVKEINRLLRATQSKQNSFIVIYGRRRSGKSRLLRHIVRERDCYFLADESDPALQRKALSNEFSRLVPGFNAVDYPSWESLLSTIRDRITPATVIVFDEFPYLVQRSPEVPSILQKIIDQGLTFHLILCGSAQRMMQGLVLDATAPLYGRCDEIMNIRPLPAGWIADALKTNPIESVESYSIWGGVPRYWELAQERADLTTALKTLVFDYEGVLHREPYRLMLDDLRSASLPYSVLSLIAGGCHRLSEIAARLGKPAMHLSRTLEHLIELDFVTRECPFGESPKSTKRCLYKCIDPFVHFWFRFIYPNLSLLERGLSESVMKECSHRFASHTSVIWEHLARESIPFIQIGGIEWKPGQRWWGKGIDGVIREIDVVAESFDGKSILLGEAKWEKRSNYREILNKFEKTAPFIPFIKNKEVVFALWSREKSVGVSKVLHIVDAASVMKALR
jgi:uncharacterized protein